MKYAFFFPGQGSQSVGMMQGLSDSEVVKSTFAEASDVLGQDFWAMVTEPNELLNQTEHTQPLMLTAGVAVWRHWVTLSHTRPAVLAGHSLGEYSALVAAEVISFVDALPLVKFRAEAMQNAVPQGQGAMAAVLGLDDALVAEACLEAAHGQVVEPVNYNSPGQVVIAGSKEAVERAIEITKAKGAKRALLLPVSVPSHCSLMKPAADNLANYLNNLTLNAPTIPVLHNVDVQSHPVPGDIKQALIAQLHHPVKWVDTVKAVKQMGVSLSAECGPGKVLAGLVKRIDSEIECHALTDLSKLNEFNALLA